jgi:hypothetical protein
MIGGGHCDDGWVGETKYSWTLGGWTSLGFWVKVKLDLAYVLEKSSSYFSLKG